MPDAAATPAAPMPSGGRADPVQASRPTDTRPRYGYEAIAVLGVSLGMSGLYALLYLIRAEITVKGGISATTATVISGSHTTYPFLDLLDGLADALHGTFPALLALVLLARDPGLPAIGLRLREGFARRGNDIAVGVGLTALIGLPGLALVWAAHQFGLNASLAVVDLPDVWYRVPLLLIDAFQNGLLEEVVVIGYLLTRLRQIGWSDQRALGVAAVLRGSYHLYQGFGGFAGNLVMGLIFGFWFQRTRRVVPLIIAHTLLDAFSFVGYLYLHGHVSWI